MENTTRVNMYVIMFHLSSAFLPLFRSHGPLLVRRCLGRGSGGGVVPNKGKPCVK